jgi:hypothetical protein
MELKFMGAVLRPMSTPSNCSVERGAVDGGRTCLRVCKKGDRLLIIME